MNTRAIALAAGLLAGWTMQATAAETREQLVDKVFARWTSETPGCAVGVAEAGQPALLRAYGMADLEHGVKITPDTVFEAGSVSKQFTAAAVALLARDGKLSLDDPVRKYLPEVPDYGTPITIRQMLNHTSGLRDWGSVAEIGGWPRGTRAYTQAHVLDIVSRQTALNFAPGTRWSYTNSGYTLAAILVERVSGMPFARFTQERIFKPLGMDHTSWRDDYTRVVANRAIAYDKRADGYHQEMPFEDTVGHGGLLTTVGDLLKWNANFEHPVVGDAAFVAQQQEPGAFNDGRKHKYGLGLNIGTFDGMAMVSHDGATAGYRALLARFPEQHLSVAVLCNAANENAPADGRIVAGHFLKRAAAPKAPSAPPAVTTSTVNSVDLGKVAGIYRDESSGQPMELTVDGPRLRVTRGPALLVTAPGVFSAPGRTFTLQQDGSMQATDRDGNSTRWLRAEPPRTEPAALAELAGSYASAEAQATWTLALEQGRLVAHNGPAIAVPLQPVYRDAYAIPGALLLVRRDAGGKVEGISVKSDRVWDLRFRKL